MIVNPVLKGLHPDPSIIRVGDDYFIATSTFEWFPGVTIYHSRDLVNWEFAASPLNRVTQLDMRGIPNGCGVFAPALSYCDGLFYLVYTVVKTNTAYQDTDNYLVTSPDLYGEWSEPVYLNSTGFDPSLFHEVGGKKWLVNRDCDTRSHLPGGGGILLREYDPARQRLVGEEYRIYKSDKIIGAEGPHLYQRGGYYYLLLAEGGTDQNHVATLARSKTITGPYTCAPNTPFLTSRDDPFNPLQKAGHASLVQTQDGGFYIAHLASRPIPSKGVCILGRETALQKVRWTEDGWLELAHGGVAPQVEVEAPALPPCPVQELPERDDFDREALGYPYHTLRVPLDEQVLTLKQRPGWLRLYGRDSLHSKYQQALVARRQQAFCCTVETQMDFNPQNYHQMAGLICMYDTDSFYYLYVTRDEAGKRRVNALVSQLGRLGYPWGDGYEIPDGVQVTLRADIRWDVLRFSWEAAGDAFAPETRFDHGVLSDDYAIQRGSWRFTGAFFGLCCQDAFDHTAFADFDYLECRQNPPL